MYAEGKGVPENDAEAVQWFRRAAGQGYVSAQGSLGAMYADGEGVPRNYMKPANGFRYPRPWVTRVNGMNSEWSPWIHLELV